MTDLFPSLPDDPAPLAHDEASLLADLPIWDTVQAVPDDKEAICRRLEKRGLVKVHRWKDDPIAIRPTMYAGRLA
jgi:hypothetical protein